MIQSFAYIGFTSPATAEWRTFGPEVLGAQLSPRDDDAVALRLDGKAPRLMVHPGPTDDVAYLGWDCGDAAGVAAAVAGLAAAGIAATADPQAAHQRQVAELVTFRDPWGFRHELTYGLADAGPFVPGRPMAGFVTGEQGLGHLVFLLPDLAAGLAFYTDVLGFKISDHIEWNGVSLRFLHCNPRHHTLALGSIPGMVGIHHLALEVRELDEVGRTLDLATERGLPMAMGYGKHTNDWMTSFYMRTPSGFDLEYGAGGRTVDDATWEFEVYDDISIWGHRQPAAPMFPGILKPFVEAST